MQTPGSRIRGIRPRQCGWIVRIYYNHVASLDSAEVLLVGVHQEPRAILVDCQADMVCDGFVHVESRYPTERHRETNTLCPIIYLLPFAIYGGRFLVRFALNGANGYL